MHNQIDHVIINSKWLSSLLDVRVKRGADINSDHHLVVGSVRLKVAALRRNAPQAKRRFDACKLKKDSVKDAFINVVSEGFRNVADSAEQISDINTTLSNIVNVYQDAGRRILGYKDSKRKPWITVKTWELIEQRRAVKNVMLSNASAEIKQSYRMLCTQIKRSARADKRA